MVVTVFVDSVRVGCCIRGVRPWATSFGRVVRVSWKERNAMFGSREPWGWARHAGLLNVLDGVNLVRCLRVRRGSIGGVECNSTSTELGMMRRRECGAVRVCGWCLPVRLARGVERRRQFGGHRQFARDAVGGRLLGDV